jgi:hypothetical protein
LSNAAPTRARLRSGIAVASATSQQRACGIGARGHLRAAQPGEMSIDELRDEARQVDVPVASGTARGAVADVQQRLVAGNVAQLLGDEVAHIAPRAIGVKVVRRIGGIKLIPVRLCGKHRRKRQLNDDNADL